MPSWGVNDDAHKASGNGTGDWKGDDPAEVTKTHIRIFPKSKIEGFVKTYHQATILQLRDLKSPLQRATPIVAPTMHWVVEMGRASLVAMTTVVAAPNSIEKPRVGEWRVSLFPRFLMML